MNPVPISLGGAPGVRLLQNWLFDTHDPAYLECDVVLVELPGNRFIDVSWTPRRSPHGHWKVTVCRRGEWHAPERIGYATDAHQAARLVEAFASLSVPMQAISCTASIVMEFKGSGPALERNILMTGTAA